VFLSVLNITSTEDKGYYDWFTCRTIVKLPGSFFSGFWTKLLLQASVSDPAVLHAVLALSSVHKRGTLNTHLKCNSNSVPDKLEQVTLQHYIKAIRHLHPHFSTMSRSSTRAALIVCIVFVSLEFLRGHFTTAQVHLQNGLKLLAETRSHSARNDELLLLKPHREAIDEWIEEAIIRLHVQVELFKQPYEHPGLLLQAGKSDSPVAIFHSFKEAWNEMDRLLSQVFHLTKQARKHKTECKTLSLPRAFLEHQECLRVELVGWLDIYEASTKVLRGQSSPDKEKINHLLRMHHAMVVIMAHACLYPSDEHIFDLHTDQFVHVISQFIGLMEITSINHPVSPAPASSGYLFSMAISIIDIGSIAPLYYTAVKCRVHRIRLQAVRFLESSSHREGIWDSIISARVSRKVMEIEERDYYKEIDTADDFPLSSIPKLRDLSLPPLPEPYRILDVEVRISGEPINKVSLLCTQRQGAIDNRCCIGEYDMPSQRWMDVSGRAQRAEVGLPVELTQ
jgi:hypothetical protein